jgi:hypothetical protein
LRRLGPRALLVATVALLGLVVGVPAPMARAQTPDRSDVVLVLDFSASILEGPANRNRFGAALERIADRVEETSAQLTAGDVTITIVQFAAKAADYPGCTDLKLLGSPTAVTRFATCLRSVASAYRKGLDPKLTSKIGIDTNYVAAMQRAAAHLPATAVRPAMILFTDGKHDARGVPASQVRVVRDRLFANRSPFALLPVGMGLDPRLRDALQSGLVSLRIVKDMPPCVSGATFDWPQVVFESPDEAGNAVAVALQDSTCTFTVETPVPTPAPTPGAVQSLDVTARDGAIDLDWTAPPGNTVTITGYRAHCRAGSGDWIEPKQAVTTDTKATIDGLTNGTAYQCEVAAVASAAAGAWTPASAVVTPLGRPAPPGKPSVEALDQGLRITVAPDEASGVSGYRFECSDDGGATWRRDGDGASADTTAQIDGLTNGVAYVCRAYAANAVGVSEPSVLSDRVTPCASLLECNGLLGPALGVLGVVLIGGLLAVIVALYRERRRGYVIAVVDVIHVANLGHGSRFGIGFVLAPDTRQVTGIVADRSPKADIRIRQVRGDRFEVFDRTGRHVTTSGEPMVILDRGGGRHELVLRAFATNTAAEVAGRG